jgi:nucleoside-diphosphate-sugar epimerase
MEAVVRPRVLLLGANGFIGKRVLERLLANHTLVKIVTRHRMAISDIPYEVIAGDLTDPAFDMGKAIEGCTVIINCAGEIRDESRMHALHVDAISRMITAIKLTAVESNKIHWVQLSSVGAYGPGFGKKRVVTEASPANPIGTYEQTKTDADRLLVALEQEQHISYSILRPSNVYGPGMTNSSLRSLAAMVKKNRYVHVGPGTAIATYVHVEDVVDALMLCAFDGRAKNLIFNISNDVRFVDFINAVADRTGSARPRIRVPAWCVRLPVWLATKVINLPITSSRIDALVTQTRYPANRLNEVLGYIPGRSIISHVDDIIQ